MAVTLAPMWKCTGSWSSVHVAQKGSHARFARSGAPRSCGSDVMLTPRAPSSATRLASLMPLSTSHAGHPVPKLRRGGAGEEVVRLRPVRVGVDDERVVVEHRSRR